MERKLRTVKLPYEEWEGLFREKLVVERALLAWEAGHTNRPHDLTE